MNEENYRILVIAPYEGIKTSTEKEISLYPNIHFDIFVGNLSEGVNIVKRLYTLAICQSIKITR